MATTIDLRPAFTTDEQRYAAIRRHDPAAEGAFFTCVKTTGIYCQPTCTARLPKRENVRFAATRAEAEALGFRACKRCRPDLPPAADRKATAVAAAVRLIEGSEEMPSLADLAAASGMSPFHFHRSFKAATGVTPRAYAAQRRSERVRGELVRRETVTEAIYGAGFNSNGRFYARSTEMLGMTPKRFRAGGAGETIRFALGQCSLGGLLVAATEKGIASIMLGDDPDALLRELQDRFPKARLVGGDAAFEQWVAKVVGLVEAPQVGLDLPLDIRGTAFQQRVWEALRKIPAGSTATYAEIAEAIGAPKAVRAVAQACGANPVAVAIPCHRVVRSDGALSGYHWGVARKRALLDREAS
ncbi:MAG TPA: bifunctional DNA-binding transcriptional regulator/O6-methylguanine-DNA methyltransferase Ada [Nitrobacter sp.]|nr:bifunctional DNA-binding transcriptional regulator/O6-methylguanine-DNA methyltransferase Ada [Nitrobacter sp.]